MRQLKMVLIVGAVIALLAGAVSAQTSGSPVQTPPIVLNGVISAISYDAGVIVLSVPNADAPSTVLPVKLKVVNTTKIIKNGQPATLKNLLVNDFCRAEAVKTSTGELVALSIVAKSPEPPPARVSGRIVKIDLEGYKFALQIGDSASRNSRVMVFSVDRGTRITKDGRPAGFGNLYIGDLALVAFRPVLVASANVPIRAISVDARTPPELIGKVCGRLVGIYPEKQVIALLPPDVTCTSADPTECAIFFQVTSITRIFKMGEATFDDLTIGDAVGVVFRKMPDNQIPPALAINVAPEKFAGKVAKVSPEDGLIVIANQDDKKLFSVTDKTRITRNGRIVPLKGILEGDEARAVYFRFGEDNVAVEIAARGPVIAGK
ncbi:MAG: hypothetical protein ACYC64_09280 [Armatimonadota bacterium]